jgi:phosphosulfolactate synthase
VLTTLDLPARASKPRSRGLTMIIDSGLPLRAFYDVVESWSPYIDLVKFGWGTAVVSPHLPEKLAALRSVGIDYFFGGTLFEKHLSQDRFDEFRRLCARARCRYVEVSNGTLPISNTEKAEYVRALAGDFTVLSEVGFKQTFRDATLRPNDWADFAHQDLDAGASLVITESRESGTTGIARADGTCRTDVLDALFGSGLRPADLLFEAPTKSLQTHLIERVGSDVNLGNIAPADVASLETLRLGLRADTMLLFGADAGQSRPVRAIA